jgi:hypothetical protein
MAPLLRSCIPLTTMLLGCMCTSSIAQPRDHTLSKLRELHLRESPGRVPLIYPLVAERRALRYRRALQAAHEWYEKQLRLSLPITLAVLDKETFAKLSSSPMPYSQFNPGLVVIPTHMDDVTSLRPPDVDFVLLGEAVAFHEAGHVFANTLKIDGGGFVNEFVANIFMAAYIRAARPDLKFLLRGPFATRLKPRYTSGADLVYLRAAVGADNYSWFQSRLQMLADFCLNGGNFVDVIDTMRSAFPAGGRHAPPLGDMMARLEDAFPGFRAQAGELAAPSTIRIITPTPCQSGSAGVPHGKRQIVVVRNDTSEPIIVSDFDGEAFRVEAASWDRLLVDTGAPARLSDGTCLIPRDEPSLVIIQKLQPTRN